MLTSRQPRCCGTAIKPASCGCHSAVIAGGGGGASHSNALIDGHFYWWSPSTGRTPPWGRLPECLWPLETGLSRCNKAEAAAARAVCTWERSFQLISSTRRRRALSVLPLKAIKMKATQSQTLLMRTFICYVGSMLNSSSCLSFLFLVVSHHKNLSAASH